MKKKWIILGAALVLMAVGPLRSDPSSLRQLSPADFLPVLLITLASFLIKTGLLSAFLLGIKKLRKRLRCK